MIVIRRANFKQESQQIAQKKNSIVSGNAIPKLTLSKCCDLKMFVLPMLMVFVKWVFKTSSCQKLPFFIIITSGPFIFIWDSNNNRIWWSRSNREVSKYSFCCYGAISSLNTYWRFCYWLDHCQNFKTKTTCRGEIGLNSQPKSNKSKLFRRFCSHAMLLSICVMDNSVWWLGLEIWENQFLLKQL